MLELLCTTILLLVLITYRNGLPCTAIAAANAILPCHRGWPCCLGSAGTRPRLGTGKECGFPEIRCTFFGGPHNTDYCILASTWFSLCFRETTKGFSAVRRARFGPGAPWKFVWLGLRSFSFPKWEGPQYRPQYTIILVMGSPKKLPLSLGTLMEHLHPRAGWLKQTKEHIRFVLTKTMAWYTACSDGAWLQREVLADATLLATGSVDFTDILVDRRK